MQAPTAVNRLNGEREVTLLAEVEGSIPSLVTRLQERLRTLSWPFGYRFEFTGQYRVLLRTAGELLAVMAGAVLLIYLIMAMQFRSAWQPFAILATVPFSLAGALAALAISRQGIDVSVGMGALTLVGISVNNAIVLLDYANRREKAGLLRQQALQAAASVRLRPILLTATTTIFALVPAALGLGVGSKVFQPFAITVIGGLLAGTVVTLVVVPTLAGLRRVRKRGSEGVR